MPSAPPTRLVSLPALTAAAMAGLLLAVPLAELRADAPSSSPSPAPSSAASPSPGPMPRYYDEGVYISGACPIRRCIAFTFDDGPDAPLTSQLLDILDQHHIHATFFVEGQHLDGSDPDTLANRAVLREARRRGNLVGNHSYHHPVFNHLDEAQLAFELDRTSDLIADVLGERPGFFRAPYGMLGTARGIRAVVHRGYTLVRWILDPRDWAEHTPEAVLRNFRYQLHLHPDGGILLMHDVHPSTIAAFPMILDEIEQRNRALAAQHEPIFEILTLDQVLSPARRQTQATPPRPKRQRRAIVRTRGDSRGIRRSWRNERPRVDLKTSTPLTPVIRAIGRRFAPHEDLYHYIMTISWAQFFGLAAFAFLVINGVFASPSWSAPAASATPATARSKTRFYFNVQTLGTIGYGGMTPATRYGHLIVTAEAIVGIFTTRADHGG